MAFNPLEYLEQGKVGFLRNLSVSDTRNIINRIRNSENKIKIINGFLPKLKRYYPRFCFEVIYDIDEYVEDLFDLVSGKLGYKIGYINLINDCEKIKNILNNSSWGKNFVFRNLTNIIRANDNNIYIILDYVFKDFDGNIVFIKRLSVYKDMHIRYIFMRYLVERHPDKINIIYDDIMKYIDGYTYEENEQLTFLPYMMSKEDISALAVCSIDSSKELWEKFKKYIFSNYKTNDLASLLLKNGNQDYLNEFKEDADKLFATSDSYKYRIYRDYRNCISIEYLKEFERYLQYFQKDNDSPYSLSLIFEYGLWDELKSYVDKYLENSNDKTCRFLASGSTSDCFKIGDYVFKLNRTKWSYEDEICPNIYLIIKNLEEHYVRGKYGVIVAGLEVQKYLSRNDVKITKEHLISFKKELRRLGYYVTDMLMNGKCGDNVAILDSYLDADCYNPDLLPESFKKLPLVLIDRDMVYKSNNENPKQRGERWL